MRGEQGYVNPNSKTLATPLPRVSERLIQRRDKPEKLGAYALAVVSGDAHGLVGSDIFQDAEDMEAIK